MKLLLVPLLLVLTVSGFLCGCNAPPNDEVLIKNFVDRKPVYEHLRDMLLADDRVLLVANWGIETPGSALAIQPPVAELSLDRYHQYLALLQEIGGKVVARSADGLPEACIYVWTDGFAGETRHEAVCWLAKPPVGQVARLNEIEARSAQANGKRATVYRHVERNWYLQRDE